MAVQVVAGIVASRTGVPPVLWSYLGVDGEVEKIFPMCLKTIVEEGTDPEQSFNLDDNVICWKWMPSSTYILQI